MYFFVDVNDDVVPASGHDFESKRYYGKREIQREGERTSYLDERIAGLCFDEA